MGVAGLTTSGWDISIVYCQCCAGFNIVDILLSFQGPVQITRGTFSSVTNELKIVSCSD